MKKYGVITKVARQGTAGNLATGLVSVWVERHPPSSSNEWEGEYELIGKTMPALGIASRVEVFHLGELLIFDENGRDQFGRNPSKWDVICETTDNIEEAVLRVQMVTKVAAG